MTKKKDGTRETSKGGMAITRRAALTGGAITGVGGGLALSSFIKSARAHTGGEADRPIKLGFQVHRTGIGAAYGRWYERTAVAAVKMINSMGGIAGRPVELVIEDDGTDPKRGAEVVEKLAIKSNVDFIFGTLFSHVVIAAAPRAGELRSPTSWSARAITSRRAS